MNPENHPTEDLDIDILQCKADILRALQQASRSATLRNPVQPSVSESAEEPDFFAPSDTPTVSKLIQDNNYPVGARILSFEQLQKAAETHKNAVCPDEVSTPAAVQPVPEKAIKPQANQESNRVDLLESQVQDLEKQLSEERLRTRDLLSDLTAMRLQSDNAEEQLKRLLAEIDEQKAIYNSHLAHTTAIQSSLEIQVTQAQAELETKNTELKNTQQKLAELQEYCTTRDSEIQQQKTFVDSIRAELAEKQQQLEQVQSTLQAYEQQIKVHSDHAAEIEQKQRQIEQLRFEQIEQQEQFRHNQVAMESKIASLEQLTDQLKQENNSLSQDLASARKALADMEEAMLQSRRDMEVTLHEKMALAHSLSEIESLSQQQQAELAALRHHNQTLAAQLQEIAEQCEAVRSELTHQNRQAEDIIHSLKLRIAELEDQIAENDGLTDSRISELKHLIDDQKSLLEKAEHQRRELENRLAGLQAENDRLCAARQETHSLQEELRLTQQRLDNASKQLERAKGDLQLVGEENNQLHHLLYLRDHELEKLQTQIRELQGHTSELECSAPPQPCSEQATLDALPQPSASDVDGVAPIQEESDTEIPRFNLAEQIMAEQRRSVASQRQSPVARPQRKQEDAISRVVGQFITPSDTSEPKPPQLIPQPEHEEAPQACPTEIPQEIAPQDTRSHASELLFADIVKRDILRFLDKKRKSLQRPSWSWNHN